MSSTHSTIEASSSIRFSIGVPVSTRRYGGVSPLTESAVLVAQFLIRCASSSTTRSGSQLPDDLEVAQQLLIIDDEEPLLALGVERPGVRRESRRRPGSAGRRTPAIRGPTGA